MLFATRNSCNEVAVWTGALSQCRNQSWDDMMGFFFLKTTKNLARAFLMYAALTVCS